MDKNNLERQKCSEIFGFYTIFTAENLRIGKMRPAYHTKTVELHTSYLVRHDQIIFLQILITKDKHKVFIKVKGRVRYRSGRLATNVFRGFEGCLSPPV